MGTHQVKITNDYYIEKIPHNFVLVEVYIGTDRDGNPQERERRTFHANLKQALERILHNESGEAIQAGFDIQDVLAQMEAMTARIELAISEHFPVDA